VRIKAFFLAGVLAVMASAALAQTPNSPSTPSAQPARTADGETRLTTRTGHELRGSVGHYTYIEPVDQRISIHGPKFGAEYTGTLSLSSRRRWFAQADVRGSGGSATYDGW
jgi:hypothetical protein